MVNVWEQFEWLSTLRGNKFFRGLWRAVWVAGFSAVITYATNYFGFTEVQVLELAQFVFVAAGLEKWWRVFLKEKD